ncbi:CLUMA_CG013283, isoform A [Clunio marinus]|uniref:CLUMA_CG013283, isoform A n=1 Tax=Clunio marinus TaxID=568069 RepID=A0A1J1IIG2_9DIPT|nr:CLUMA_CG013283, isoform A [Clunio marinus]
MNGTEKGIKEVAEIIKSKSSGDLLKANKIVKSSEVFQFLRKFSKSKSIKHLLTTKNIKNSDNKKQNEHDMLQANQANLKGSSSYANNIKQVISLNSTIHERYQKLQKISLHHIFNKGIVKL